MTMTATNVTATWSQETIYDASNPTQLLETRPAQWSFVLTTTLQDSSLPGLADQLVALADRIRRGPDHPEDWERGEWRVPPGYPVPEDPGTPPTA